jgi:hypothetical protein
MATARSVVNRSRPLTLLSSDPAIGPVVTGAPSEVRRQVPTFDDVTSGRVSLGILASLLVLSAAFYLWTRSIQGGG